MFKSFSKGMKYDIKYQASSIPSLTARWQISPTVLLTTNYLGDVRYFRANKMIWSCCHDQWECDAHHRSHTSCFWLVARAPGDLASHLNREKWVILLSNYLINYFINYEMVTGNPGDLASHLKINELFYHWVGGGCFVAKFVMIWDVPWCAPWAREYIMSAA